MGSFGFVSVLLFISLGSLAGFLSGLLGIGGGVIIVPIVTLLFEGHGIPHGMAIKLALGTSLATIVVTAAMSVFTHHRKGAVDWGLFRVMAPAVVVGSLLGYTPESELAELDALMVNDLNGELFHVIGSVLFFLKRSNLCLVTLQPCAIRR